MRPPRVGSRRKRNPGPAASTAAATSFHSGAQSLSTGVRKWNSPRAASTATAWSPMPPLRMTASPSRTVAAPSSCGTTTSPTPVVVMNRPSQAPRSTTLVSPVTMSTPASAAVAAIEAHSSRRSPTGKPSSMTKAAARASGRAAAVARSFTVPATARRPMSPPGKRSGRTTWLSVVKAMRPGRRQHGRVVEPREHGVGEGRDEDVADEVAVELAAAAVTEQDAVAGAVSHRDPGTCSGRRRRPRCSPCRRRPGLAACSAARRGRSRPGR